MKKNSTLKSLVTFMIVMMLSLITIGIGVFISSVIIGMMVGL